jgi:CO/xanthine dehydrogenase FAD-binding subunit
VKPAPFEYHRPASREEAFALLGPEAKPLAGGQSLVPLMNFRLARPAALVDLGRLGLDGIRRENGSVVVGAMTRQYDLELSGASPLLAEALQHVAHLAIRTRGTVGGSLVHADPTAELPVCAVALGAELVLESAAGRRVVPADDFFVHLFTTALAPEELLVEARFPAAQRVAFEEFALRHGDFALVCVAAVVGDDGARVALGGVGPRPFLAVGAPDELPDRVADEIQPPDDAHVPVGYRRDLARALTARALRRAA